MSAHNKEFLRWEVKPIWKVRYPSVLVSAVADETFTIFGVDRGGLDIVRNWDKIHSVEQFNQGFVAKPEDFTFTIAIKERGSAFEKVRRLAMGGVLFDVSCSLVKEADETAIYGDRPEESGVPEIPVLDDDGNPVLDADGNPIVTPATPAYIPWMDGFEKYNGCIVQREGQTVELATFPVREFECEFLRHQIMKSSNFNTAGSLEEGDGTYPHLADLSL